MLILTISVTEKTLKGFYSSHPFLSILVRAQERLYLWAGLWSMDENDDDDDDNKDWWSRKITVKMYWLVIFERVMLLYAHTTRGRTTPSFRSPAASASRGSLIGCRTSDSPAPAPTSWVRTCTVTRPLGGSRAPWSLDSAALRCCWRCWSEDNARHSSAQSSHPHTWLIIRSAEGLEKTPQIPGFQIAKIQIPHN